MEESQPVDEEKKYLVRKKKKTDQFLSTSQKRILELEENIETLEGFNKFKARSKKTFLTPFTCDYVPDDAEDKLKIQYQCGVKRTLNGLFIASLIGVMLLGILYIILWKIPSVDYTVTGTIITIIIMLVLLIPSLFIGFMIMRKKQKNATIGLITTTLLSVGTIIAVFASFQNI